MEDDPKKIGTAEEIKVRQGITGQGVRYVLICSLSGAIIAMALVYLFVGAIGR